MSERAYNVFRTMKGSQLYTVTARSANDAVRKVLEGHGEAVNFEITSAACTAVAFPAYETTDRTDGSGR